MLKPGDKAPDFTGTDDSGKKISLKDFKGKTLVLYFYPTDDTPTCTKEACEFAEAYQSFLKKGVPVVGVSPDTEQSHQKFRKKYNLPFPLIADTDLKICHAYDVWQEKTTFGKTYMGVVRSTFVIDEKGKISAVFSNVRIKGHINAVFEAATT